MGHSCFLLEGDGGVKIITDPYESGSYKGQMGYRPVAIDADVVTVSHEHLDHNYTKGIKTNVIIRDVGVVKVKDIRVEGISSYHDNQQGFLRGRSIIFIINFEGLKIIHFGDLGTVNINTNMLKDADVVFIPVGGVFTLGADQAKEIIKKINPKITVPMHFKTEKIGFNIERVDKFLQSEDYEERNNLLLDSNSVNSFKRIVVLKYKR